MGPVAALPSPASRNLILRLSVVFAFAAALATAAAADTVVGPLVVTSSDAAGLRLEAALPDAAWQETADGRTMPLMPGFTASGEPGGPLVPAFGAWILVPPGTRPVLEIESETWGAAQARPLALAPVPASPPGRPGDLVDLAVEAGAPLPEGWTVGPQVAASLGKAGQARSGGALALGEVAWWRGRRVAALTMTAVRHQAGGAAPAALASGRWRVRFEPLNESGGEEAGAIRRRSTANDERFGSMFLNPELLRGAGPEPAAMTSGGSVAASAAGKALLLAPEVKIGISATRLYRVTAERLRSRGLLPDTPLAESSLRLYQRRYLAELDGAGGRPYLEVEVPIRVVGDGGDFDGDDFFVFYGLRPRDDGAWTDDSGDAPVEVPGCGDQNEWANGLNIYWLAAAEPGAGEAWARMDEVSLPAAGPERLRSYRRTERVEEQLFMRQNIIRTDIDRLAMNHPTDTSVSVGIASQWAPDPLGAPARIEVTGAMRDFGASAMMQVDLVVDNAVTTSLGIANIQQLFDQTFGFDVAADVLAGQTAKVTLTKSPPGQMRSYLNWVRVSYDALYRAVGGEQRFHTGAAAGARSIGVTGFGDADLGLVDITDPHRPAWVSLAAQNIEDAGDGTFTLAIMPTQADAAAPRAYWAADDLHGGGVGEFPYYDATVAADPVDPTDAGGRTPDVIVVTHGEFRSGLDRWVAHRQARSGGDLDIHVVDVADLYDWYSGGLKSTWAIKRFVNHAIGAWDAWSLVLVGDANENQRMLGVPSGARAWSEDLVPTHYHVQNALTGIYELMATDKWYVSDEGGTSDLDDDFPDGIRAPWTMLAGRLAVNSASELETMIDKIVQVESVGETPAWRRRGIFLADDAFSNGYGAAGLTDLVYNSGELQFGWSERDSLAPWWRGGTPVALDTTLVLLDDLLAEAYPGTGTRDLYDVRVYTGAHATAHFLRALNEGGLVAHYQGHANANVLSSEYWFQDRPYTRRDVESLTNTGPWVFFGMGCHISDWARDVVITRTAYNEPSLGEKLLTWTSHGASASYGSSGYEYIYQNRAFGERIFRVWTLRPPVATAGGAPVRSRWLTGELLWAAEAEHLAATWWSSLDRDMVAQYELLGDPLMRLDAGPPQVEAVLETAGGDQVVSGTVVVGGSEAGNQRIVRVAARDEAGIDRLRVTDSMGADLTDAVVVMADSLPPGQADHQEVHYRLQVPVRPFPHDIDVEVWDTGAPLAQDRHWTLTLQVEQDVVFTAGGEVVDPATFTFETDVPVAFSATVTGGAWLDEGTTWALAGDNLDLTDVALPSLKSNTAEFSFTATAAGGTEGERSVVLTIDGYPTTWVLQAGEQSLPEAAITRVYSYPNPMSDHTRFLFETGAAQGRGVIRVFSVAGRVVARIPFRFDGGGAGIVEWDARDDEGDALANGTYLYRVEMDAPGGRINGPVQRLVVMR